MCSGIRLPMAPDTRVRSSSRSVIVAVVIFPPEWASAAPRTSPPAGARQRPLRASGSVICSRARPVSMASHSSAICRGGNGRPSAFSLLISANICATPSTVRACRAAYLRLSSGSRAAWTPELGDQQPPARRAALVPLGLVEQRGEVPGASQLAGQLRVPRGPLGDPVLEQGQEHVGLAGEARVHRALGEARLVGDLVQGRGVVAPLQEHPAGRGQQQGAVAVVLFGAGQARTHTGDI